MAYSTVTYSASSGQASSKAFSIAFTDESGHADTSSKPFLSESHIKAKVKGVANSDFTISGTTLTFGGSTTIVQEDLVEIYRETPRKIADRTVDFANASLLSAADLDKASIHEQFIIQEALDRAGPAKKWSAPSTYSYDAAGKQITDLGTPTAATDAATKDYVDTQVIFEGGAASAQCWEFTGTGTKSSFTLQSPTASNDVNELFIVDVQGVAQAPSANDGTPVRDYKVIKSEAGVYSLVFETGSFPSNTANTDCPENGHSIIVQNMGISKSALSGALTFESDAAGNTPITIKGASGQTAALLSLTDSSANIKFKVEKDGDIVGGNTALTSNDASETALAVTGASGQSEDLLRVTKNGGTNVVVVDEDGKTTLATNALVVDSGSTAVAATITKTGSTTGNILEVKEGSNTFQITNNDGKAFIENMQVGNDSALSNGANTRTALSVNGYASQAIGTPALQVGNSASEYKFKVNPGGHGICATHLSASGDTKVASVPLSGGLVAACIVKMKSTSSRTLPGNNLNISSVAAGTSGASPTNLTINTTFNFSTAMPDTNYLVMVTPSFSNAHNIVSNNQIFPTSTYKSTTQFTIAHAPESVATDGNGVRYELNVMVYYFNNA